MKILLGLGTVSTISTIPKPSVSYPGKVASRAEAARRWVGEGLEMMFHVESVEMEIMTGEMGDREKVRWYQMLEEELRRKGLDKLKVVCVKRIKTERIKGDIEWEGQWGGDEYGWPI